MERSLMVMLARAAGDRPSESAAMNTRTTATDGELRMNILPDHAGQAARWHTGERIYQADQYNATSKSHDIDERAARLMTGWGRRQHQPAGLGLLLRCRDGGGVWSEQR